MLAVDAGAALDTWSTANLASIVLSPIVLFADECGSG